MCFTGETDVLLDSYGILKVDERQYQALDRRYLLAGMREAYGYRLLTNERRYYQENYPDLVMEKGSIDDILILTARGGEAMKGLLTKDFRILAGQKRYFTIIILIALIFSLQRSASADHCGILYHVRHAFYSKHDLV